MLTSNSAKLGKVANDFEAILFIDKGRFQELSVLYTFKCKFEQIEKRIRKKVLLIGMLFSSAIMLLACSGETTYQHDSAQSNQNTHDYSAFFSHDSVMDISITIDETDWMELIMSPEAKTYYKCDVNINGTEVKEAGIRTKGNSSLDEVSQSDSDRYSFKIEFDHYHNNRSMNGLDKLVLNNIFGDSSYMIEYTAYRLNDYMDVITPYYAFAFITINGKPWGLYLAIEGIEEAFAARTGNTDAEIYKPENSIIDRFRIESGLEEGYSHSSDDLDGGADLIYREESIESYPNIFENAVFEPDDEAKERCVRAIKGLNSEEDVSLYVDVDECIRYLAVLTFSNNPDSYYSQAICNYYLMENEGVLSMLPWDLNRSFCGMESPDIDYIINAPINDPWDTALGFMIGYKTNKVNRPMFDRLAGSEEYRGRYYCELSAVSNLALSETFKEEYDKTTQMIWPYIEKDTTCFYDKETILPMQQRLIKYIELRAQSVLAQTEGRLSPDSRDRANRN